MNPKTETWVANAELDFRLAERAAAPPDPIYQGVCYHAQQCVEKYLKAMLQEGSKSIPRTHDLSALLALMTDALPKLASLTERIEDLSPYAVVMRYPGWETSVDDLSAEAEAASATMVAARLVIRRVLGFHPAEIKRKAFAYITHDDRLLAFRHPFAPDVGIQVPAGTIKDDEEPAEAVLREAREETGRLDLELVDFLGESQRDMTDFGIDEMHRRFFYHLRCSGNPPSTWRHTEDDPSDGSTTPIVFEFFWARLPDEVPALIADHGAYLTQLIARLATEGILPIKLA